MGWFTIKARTNLGPQNYMYLSAPVALLQEWVAGRDNPVEAFAERSEWGSNIRIIASFVSLKVDVYWWQRNAQDKTVSPMGPFLVTKSIYESSLSAFMIFFLPSWMRVPWIRGSPTKKAKKGTFASLARPTDGFLDFGRPGLVLGPLIQGRMRAGLSGTHVQLNGKCRKIVFSSMRCSKFMFRQISGIIHNFMAYLS